MSMHRLKATALATAAAGALALTTALAAPAYAEGKPLNAHAGASIVGPEADSLTLEISKGTLIRLDRPASEVFVANPKIADVQVKSPRVIYIFGKAAGETSFYALDKDDKTIFSSGVAVSRNLSALRKALSQMLPGVDIDVSALGQMTVLRGNVSAPDQSALAEKLAHSVLGTEQVLNNLNVVQPTQVNLRVRIAEISRSVLKQLGVNWESFYNGSNFGIGLLQGRDVYEMIKDPITELPLKNFFQPESAASLVGSVTPGGLDLNYAIDALDTEGFLKVLAEPNLTALTGQSANFLAGGEFPIPVPSRDGIGIQYREFGVKLDFTPTVLNSGRISMRVRPEVSDLSTAGSIQIQGISVPSISTRRAETTIELGSGQSFAIAGLIQNNVTHDTTKLPGLGDIPILGALFKSDKFRHEETELLIVVTPYIVRPVSARKLMLPTDHYVAPNDMERYLKGKHWVASKSAKTTSQDQAPGPSIKKRAGFQLD